MTVEEDWLDCRERSDTAIVIEMTAANVWTLPLLRATFMYVEESWFRTFVPAALLHVNDYCAGKALEESHTGLLTVLR